MTLNTNHLKRINSCLFKFIWNRHYSATKAPERLKREITTLPIKKGGFGMIDIAELDDSLKLRSLGRLLDTNHPVLRIVKEHLRLDDFFHPKILTDYENCTSKALLLLATWRQKIWQNWDQCQANRKIIELLKTTKLKM